LRRSSLPKANHRRPNRPECESCRRSTQTENDGLHWPHRDSHRRCASRSTAAPRRCRPRPSIQN
jgi:hypothetical protein